MEHYTRLNGCVVEIVPHIKSTKAIITDNIAFLESKHNEDAFYVADLGDIIVKHQIWKKLLPRVHPFYAFKCNHEDAVLRLLADLGTSFDCSNKLEIEKILDLGVSPSRIIYAHTCKQKSFIRYAAKHNVRTMTFDNEAELYKVKEIFPEARLVLRILPPTGFKVMIPLGDKYGCPLSKAVLLLTKAKELELNVVGISFHVGSGCEDAEAYMSAVEQAHQVFELGQELGFNLDLLDIGGGFPGQTHPLVSFKEMARVVNAALDKYFPSESGVQIIAEPGRYYMASAFTLVVNVIAKRIDVQHKPSNASLAAYTAEQIVTLDDEEPEYHYYVNESIHGSFLCQLFCSDRSHPFLVKDCQEGNKFLSRIWGQTCNPRDCILEKALLPELHVGDWIFFDNMGAYSTCVISGFNGVTRPLIYWYCSQENWKYLCAEQKKNGRD